MGRPPPAAVWTWMFLLLLLKACTGEEVLYVSLWACYSGSVGASGGVWGVCEHGIACGGLLWACFPDGSGGIALQAAGRSVEFA